MVHLARDYMGWDGSMEEQVLHDRPCAVQSLRRLGCLNGIDPRPVEWEEYAFSSMEPHNQDWV